MSESSQVTKIFARQIFDSRGKPTIEVEVTTLDGKFHRAAVPSGASTGVHEALELRDWDKSNFLGQGVSKAIDNVNNVIAPDFLTAQLDICNQRAIDDWLIKLDGTKNKSKLGANAILGVSLAICIAAAASKEIPLYQHINEISSLGECTLPIPSFNIINGGSHAGNPLPFQEFMILPTEAKSFVEAMKIGSEIYQHLKTIIKQKFGQDAVNVGDEGGFAPNVRDVYECLDLIQEAISSSGYKDRVKIGLDVAASEFHVVDKVGYYNLDWKVKQASEPKILSGEQLADLYLDLIQKYPIISIEDAFDQDDWQSWSYLCSKTDIQIVGDDLTVTNPERILKAINEKSCNALLLKVNQIGTLTESIDAAIMAKKAGWNVMVSHRSGETEDTFIADLAVGISAGQIKSGAPCRSERLAKYNQIIRIEEKMSGKLAHPFAKK